ncbi:hypothetical protein [Aquisphaera giovannonii]|nr:hypothetical protein [Aquisphaera giovannonii]
MFENELGKFRVLLALEGYRLTSIQGAVAQVAFAFPPPVSPRAVQSHLVRHFGMAVSLATICRTLARLRDWELIRLSPGPENDP